MFFITGVKNTGAIVGERGTSRTCIRKEWQGEE
jgi:hypothetical protein